MTKQEAIAKAAKLLRLATSSNPHEAALAASRAQEIIDKHNLSMGDVNNTEQQTEDNEPIVNFGQDYLDASGPGSPTCTYKVKLCSGIARANQCRIILYAGRGISIIGRPGDVATVRYFTSWLTQEIINLVKRDCLGRSDAYKNAYRVGAVITIVEKVRAQFDATVQAAKQEQAGNNLALVRINNAVARLERRAADVDKFIETTMKLGKARAGGSFSDHGGFAAGRKAAQTINIGARKAVGRGAVGQLN